MLDEATESPFSLIAKHQRTVPISIEALAKDLGLTVYSMPLPREVSGQIMRDSKKGGSSGFAIYVNSLDHPNRQRFTLAHEIAHFVLHRDLIEWGIIDDTMYRSKELSGHYETQANRLAADILMPIMSVKKFRAVDQTPEALARRFAVSPAAMKIRLQGLRQP